MPIHPDSQRVVKRIELVLGKSQVGDLTYYLVKEYNESLQDSRWMTTLEVIPKGIWKITKFNITKIKNVKSVSYFVDEKALEENLAYQCVGSISQTQSEKSESFRISKKSVNNGLVKRELGLQLQVLKKQFSESLKKKVALWNQSEFIPLFFLKVGPKITMYLKEQQKKKQLDYIKQQNQSTSRFVRPEIEIDYKSLNQYKSQNIEQDENKAFLGIITIKKHHIFLIKGKNDSLLNSKWAYLGGNIQNSKRKSTIKIFMMTLESRSRFTIDQKYLIEQLKLTQTAFSKQETELVTNFISRKIKQLYSFIHRLQINLDLEVIGKAKFNDHTLYLTKSINQLNRLQFRWQRIYQNSSRANKFFKKFNQIYQNQPLPFFIPQWSQFSTHFTDLLQNIKVRRIQKVFAKKFLNEGVFYLAKFQNQNIWQSEWVSRNRNFSGPQFHDTKIRQFNKNFTFHLSKEKILIQLYKEKLNSVPKQLINTTYQINQKQLLKQALEICQCFEAQAKKIKELFSDKQNQETSMEQVKKQFQSGLSSQSDQSEPYSDTEDICFQDQETQNEVKVKQEQSQSKKGKKQLKKVKAEDKKQFAESKSSRMQRRKDQVSSRFCSRRMRQEACFYDDDEFDSSNDDWEWLKKQA